VVCVVQLVGPSGSGKTTVIVEVSRRLKMMGYKVAVLKHTHHDIDVPGKDSWRFLEEGGVDYSIVFRGSGDRVAIFTKQSLEKLVEEIEGKVNVILVEGFKNINLDGIRNVKAHRIEVMRGENLVEVMEKTLNHIIQCLKEEIGKT